MLDAFTQKETALDERWLVEYFFTAEGLLKQEKCKRTQIVAILQRVWSGANTTYSIYARRRIAALLAAVASTDDEIVPLLTKIITGDADTVINVGKLRKLRTKNLPPYAVYFAPEKAVEMAMVRAAKAALDLGNDTERLTTRLSLLADGLTPRFRLAWIASLSQKYDEGSAEVTYLMTKHLITSLWPTANYYNGGRLLDIIIASKLGPQTLCALPDMPLHPIVEPLRATPNERSLAIIDIPSPLMAAWAADLKVEGVSRFYWEACVIPQSQTGGAYHTGKTLSDVRMLAILLDLAVLMKAASRPGHEITAILFLVVRKHKAYNKKILRHLGRALAANSIASKKECEADFKYLRKLANLSEKLDDLFHLVLNNRLSQDSV